MTARINGCARRKIETRRRNEELAPTAYERSVQLAALKFGVAKGDILPSANISTQSRKQLQTVRARRVALYLAMTQFNLSLSSVGSVARMTKEGVRRALHAVEDWRDDPVFDNMIAELEKQIYQGMAA